MSEYCSNIIFKVITSNILVELELENIESYVCKAFSDE